MTRLRKSHVYGAKDGSDSGGRQRTVSGSELGRLQERCSLVKV